MLLNTVIGANIASLWSLGQGRKGGRGVVNVGPVTGVGVKGRFVTPQIFSKEIQPGLRLSVFTLTFNFLSDQLLCKRFVGSWSPGHPFSLVLS